MSELDEIRKLLSGCTTAQRRMLFNELRESLGFHPFEQVMNARAEILLDALARAPELTIRGVRGILGEAAFAVEVVGTLSGWKDVTQAGNHSYDIALEDAVGIVRVQVKMQRRKKHEESGELRPYIRGDFGDVEVQRTRSGKKAGKSTRPYTFGSFDILAACMEPSHKRWNSFLYVPEKWLFARENDPHLIEVHQPVSLEPGAVWTDDFTEAVQRMRSREARPPGLEFHSKRQNSNKRSRTRGKKT